MAKMNHLHKALESLRPCLGKDAHLKTLSTKRTCLPERYDPFSDAYDSEPA